MSSRATVAPAPYLLGRTEHERMRLQLQGSILNPVTERFLREAGISAGMRILDLGSGIGDVALIAAGLTGPGGEVVGIDRDDEALDVARQRAGNAAHHHVTFECVEIQNYEPDELFDAVVARHLLIHTADAAEILRKAASLLRPGGVVAIQEYDLSFWPAGYPEAPLAANLQWALVELFRSATPHANIGMRLSRLMSQAGLSNPRSGAQCLIESGPDTLFYEWLAETVRSVLPVLEKLGLAAVAGDIDTLAQRLRDQMMGINACVTTPLIVGAFATRS